MEKTERSVLKRNVLDLINSICFDFFIRFFWFPLTRSQRAPLVVIGAVPSLSSQLISKHIYFRASIFIVIVFGLFMFFALSSKKEVKGIKIDDKERMKERKSPLEPMVLECLYTFIQFSLSLSIPLSLSLRFFRLFAIQPYALRRTQYVCCYVIASMAVLFHFSFFFCTWTRRARETEATKKNERYTDRWTERVLQIKRKEERQRSWNSNSKN